MRLLLWIPVAAVTVLSGSDHARTTVVVPSAFHWSNAHYLEGRERDALDGVHVQRFYHKVLDIDRDAFHGAHPVSAVPVPDEWKGYYHDDGPLTSIVEIVPCVYFTNNTFMQCSDAEVDRLSGNLLRKLRMLCPTYVQGLLLDCDWTATTRDKFFRLVRTVADSVNVPVSVTIRLHQFAHPERTGVPPADRGMLMVYNVGKVQEAGGINSIYDEATAAPYFANAKPYPLPLDLALPAYSWGAQFRKGRFMGILQDAQVRRAEELGLLSGEVVGIRQVVQENNEILPELHLGDEVRAERMTPERIQRAAEQARSAVNSDTTAVALFEVGANAYQALDTTDLGRVMRTVGAVRKPTIIVDASGTMPPVGDPAWDTIQLDSAMPVPDLPEVHPLGNRR